MQIHIGLEATLMEIKTKDLRSKGSKHIACVLYDERACFDVRSGNQTPTLVPNLLQPACTLAFGHESLLMLSDDK